MAKRGYKKGVSAETELVFFMISFIVEIVVLTVNFFKNALKG